MTILWVTTLIMEVPLTPKIVVLKIESVYMLPSSLLIIGTPTLNNYCTYTIMVACEPDPTYLTLSPSRYFS